MFLWVHVKFNDSVVESLWLHGMAWMGCEEWDVAARNSMNGHSSHQTVMAHEWIISVEFGVVRKGRECTWNEALQPRVPIDASDDYPPLNLIKRKLSPNAGAYWRKGPNIANTRMQATGDREWDSVRRITKPTWYRADQGVFLRALYFSKFQFRDFRELFFTFFSKRRKDGGRFSRSVDFLKFSRHRSPVAIS